MSFQVRKGGEFEDLLVKGVNLGTAKPGHFPGEMAITRAEYDRWIAQIADLGANAIRVYTIHPPAFYRALAEHNADAEQPLYLFHGNWIPEGATADSATAFDDRVTKTFDGGLRRVIDVVHGNVTLQERPGHASGTFDADVSPYTLGYVAGVEWPPQFVSRTNRNPQPRGHTHRFVRPTGQAAPFERWLATRLDRALQYESSTYNETRPVSFVNWPTTDPLSHPIEPLEWEDRVAIDPDNVVATSRFEPGLFATYHIYPYYPDFLNLSEQYVTYTDAEGDPNNFAGYLHELTTNTQHPLLVGEFGVPSSRGIAHNNVHGMDQGHNTEIEQGRADRNQFEAIVNEGTAGGLVFAWQDGWYKSTWNTDDYTTPGRRPNWLDVQSPEERFGLLSFDPSAGITLSGTESEWADTARLYTSTTGPVHALEDGFDDTRTLRELRTVADEAYLSVRIRYEDLGEQVDWSRMTTVVGIDLTPDNGNTNFPGDLALEPERGIDFVVELRGPDRSRVRVASHYDRFYYEYGEQGSWVEHRPYAETPDNGRFHPIRLATSYPLDIPGSDRTIPFRYTETGRLRFGVADPTHHAFDSLADVHVDPDENTIELRLPWQLLNVRDPSSRTIAGDFWQEGLGAQTQIDDLGFMVATGLPGGNGTVRDLPGGSNVTDLLPATGGRRIPEGAVARFSWEPWDHPGYNERLKQSAALLGEAYRNVGGGQ